MDPKPRARPARAVVGSFTAVSSHQRAPYGLALSDGNGGKVAYPDRIGQSSSISHLLCGARHLLLVLPCASRRSGSEPRLLHRSFPLYRASGRFDPSERPPGVKGGPIEVPYDVEDARTDGVVA